MKHVLQFMISTVLGIEIERKLRANSLTLKTSESIIGFPCEYQPLKQTKVVQSVNHKQLVCRGLIPGCCGEKPEC